MTIHPKKIQLNCKVSDCEVRFLDEAGDIEVRRFDLPHGSQLIEHVLGSMGISSRVSTATDMATARCGEGLKADDAEIVVFVSPAPDGEDTPFATVFRNRALLGELSLDMHGYPFADELICAGVLELLGYAVEIE
jgi:hypothetical protein